MLGLLFLSYHREAILTNESPEMIVFLFHKSNVHSQVKWPVLANELHYVSSHGETWL